MEEIFTNTFLKLHRIISNNSPKDDSLLGGRLGLALYYHALYEAFEKPEHAAKASELLEEVFSNLSINNIHLMGNSFGGGAAGLGYVVTEFHKSGLIEISLSDDLKMLDTYLYKTALTQIINEDRIDFLHGAAGTIHYFTQRLPDPTIEEYLKNLITTLCSKAVKENNGIWLKNNIKDTPQMAGINLSLSHGLSGFLILLINAYKAGIQLACVKDVVTQGIDFILSYQQDIDIPKNKWTFFPSTITTTDHSEFFVSPRLAWCYGDFGPVLLLYKAASIIDNAGWIDKADLFGTFTIMRNDAVSTASTESMFCHGASGIAQVYNTLYNLSGITRYKETQKYWLNQVIELLPSELEKAVYHEKECDLLEGLVGINLSLLSYISPKPLSWRNTLLIG